MEIRSVGAELFHADGQTDKQTEGRDGTNSFFFFAIFPSSEN